MSEPPRSGEEAAFWRELKDRIAEPPRTGWRRWAMPIWSVANSNVGMWLIVGVIAACVTQAYSEDRVRIERAAARQASIAKLTFEIEHRLARVRHGVQASFRDGKPRAAHLDIVRRAVRGDSRPGDHFHALHDYRDRTLLSLLSELGFEDTEQRQAADDLREWLDTWSRGLNGKAIKVTQDYVDETLREVSNRTPASWEVK